MADLSRFYLLRTDYAPSARLPSSILLRLFRSTSFAKSGSSEPLRFAMQDGFCPAFMDTR